MALVDVVPVLRVDDLAKALEFYTSVLGFEESFRWGEPPFYAGLTIGPAGPRSDTHVHINRSDEAPGQGEIYVSVDDVDAAYEAVRAAGVQLAVDLRDQDYGMRDFSVRDPAGNFLTVGMPTHDAGATASDRSEA